jgi:small multidrug resistance pump
MQASWTALVMALVLNAGANLLLKFHARYMKPTDLQFDGVNSIWHLIARNWLLWLGLFCFATNVLFYRFALGKIRISIAYPIMVGGGFLIIAVIAWRYLGEALSVTQWAGVALILVGIVLVSRDMTPGTAG